MNNWVIYNKKCDEKKIAEDFNISPLLVRILNNRDINTYEDIKMILSSDLSDIHDENLLPNIDKASEIIIDKIKSKKNIRIIGDYDIDGVCSTYILYDSIKKMGGIVSYHIPHRVIDGYGINKNIIDKCIEDKIDTIITCDNGISANIEIKYAKENGLTVVVTDHHEVGDVLPLADAIVDPKIKDSKYPFCDVCGAVVAWKLIRYIKSRYIKDYDIKNDTEYLDFASLATIGDIMPIVNENHIIAKLGLKAIEKTTNKGLYKLLEISNLINKDITTYHVGYIIGPLINAAGRLDDAKLSLELFLSNDDDRINEIAYKLKSLNDERKNLTEDGVKKAVDLIEDKYKNDKVLVAYISGINESVCGIVAGRIKEMYNKPTIIFSDAIEEDIIKASGRSIDAYNMYDGLAKYSEWYEKFGGHKGAAGLSMKKEYLDILRKSLNDGRALTEKDLEKKIYIDAEVPIYAINEDIIKDIKKIEPYGQKLDAPVLGCRDVRCIVDKVYGEKQNVLKMTLIKDEKRVKGVYFKEYAEYKMECNDDENVNIIYSPRINEYNGYTNIEINIKDMKKLLYNGVEKW